MIFYIGDKIKLKNKVVKARKISKRQNLEELYFLFFYFVMKK